MDVPKEGTGNSNAVAYLTLKPDEAPEKVKDFVEELVKYDSVGKTLSKSIEDAENTIQELNIEMQRLYGSVNTMIHLILKKLTPEEIKTFSEKRAALKEKE